MLWSRRSLVSVLLVLILSMVITSLSVTSSVSAINQTNSTTTVYLDPPTINATAINQTFTVNINISDAINVSSVQIALAFNATLLECTGFFWGEFMVGASPTPGTIDNTAGLIGIPGPFYTGFLGAETKASGSGRLAYVTFRVKAPGLSDLHLRNMKVMELVYDELLGYYVPKMVLFNIIDVYTVVVDTTPHTVVTVSNTTGVTGNYGSGFYNHAFSIPDKEISFNVSFAGRDPFDTSPSFSNVTIPATLMWVDALEDWKVIINGVEGSTVTFNGTHYSLYFTYPVGIHKIQITSEYVIEGRELVASLDAPTFLRLGYSSLLNMTVYNLGFSNETNVELFLLINGSVPLGGNVTIPLLEMGSNYTFSYLWTPLAVEADYNVTAYTPLVYGENVTTNNVATKLVFVRSLYITVNPDSGPIGTKVTVDGAWFSPNSQKSVTFNDVPMGYAMTDEFGSFTFVFNVPVSVAGLQTVKAYETANLSSYALFTVIDVTPLDVEIDVGSIHFRGESAEFYVQIAFKGTAVNATSISAMLYKPDGTTEALADPSPIATGFYKISYSLVDAQNGTYALVVEASYITSTIESYGTAFKTFLLSSTLAEELTLIEDLRDETENLKAEISVLNTTLNNLNQMINQTITQLETDFLAKIAALNTTLNSLNETITQLETRIDAIKSAQEAFTPPLYAAVVLALIAAVGAIVTILLRRKSTS